MPKKNNTNHNDDGVLIMLEWFAIGNHLLALDQPSPQPMMVDHEAPAADVSRTSAISEISKN